MRKYSCFVLLICVVLAVGCGKDRGKSASDEQQSDPQQTATEPAAPPAVPEPAPQEPAATPEPSQPPAKKQAAQKPLPPKPAVAQPIIVPAGTSIAVRTTNALSSESSKAGETFEASLAQPVVVGGVTVLPAGATATGKIVKAASAGRMKGEGVLSLALTSLTVKGHSYNLITEPVSQTAKSRGKRSATMIGGGAGAGALIGGLAGGGKGAAIGALAGGAAGTAGATMTGKRAVEVPAETILSFRLSAPLKLQ
jgi:hypothetical protein